MNAPKAPEAVLQLEAELVPVGVICVSDTHLQQMRRKRFSEEGLLELAATIKSSGVINPILLRPWPKSRDNVSPTPKYELVAGERRWLASQKAGLAHVPAVIRALDDGDVLVAQMIENKQRDDYTPLEESAGYTDLKAIKKWDAQAIADHIGKSRSYVYARMKLAELCPEAREAFAAGKLDYSKALLLARFPEVLQAKALKVLAEENWQGEPISYKRAFGVLREKLMVPLSTAPFALDDDKLFKFVKRPGAKNIEDVENHPACVTCPSNSANDAELREHLGIAHVCTNSPCFELKVIAFAERRRKQAEADKRPVITGEAAKKIFPGRNKLVGYVDLDAVCEDDDYPEPMPRPAKGENHTSPAFETREREFEERANAHQQRTYRQLLEGIKPEDIALAEDPKTKRVREIVPVKLARELIQKKHKLKLPTWLAAPASKRPATQPFDCEAYKKQQQAADQRRAREREFRLAVAKAIAEKCAGPLNREELVDIADSLSDSYGTKQALKAIYGKMPEPGQLKDAELGKFIRLAGVVDVVEQVHMQPTDLLAMAKRYKIDVAKIKRELEAKQQEAEKPKAQASATKPKRAPGAAPQKAAAKKPAAKK